MSDLKSESIAAEGTTPARLRRGTAATIALLLGVLFSFALLSWPGSAGASPAYPPTQPVYPPSNGCTVSTTTVGAGPGDSVTLVGSGFAPNTTVALSIPSASAPLGSVTTSSSGSFSHKFTWPASVNGKSAAVVAMAGSTTCQFTLTNGTDSVSAHRASGGGTTGSDTGGGGLSSTGFATLTATTIAVLLIGGGAIFLGLARRRRV